MKKLFPLVIFLALTLIGCSSSSYISYRPAGSTEPMWNINLTQSQVPTVSFKLTINDSVLIDKGVGFFTGELEEKAMYNGKEVKLIITHNVSLFSNGFDAMIFVNNELAGKLKF